MSIVEKVTPNGVIETEHRRSCEIKGKTRATVFKSRVSEVTYTPTRRRAMIHNTLMEKKKKKKERERARERERERNRII